MTFDRSGLDEAQLRFLRLTLEAIREIERMEARPDFRACFRVWDYSPHGEYRSWLLQTPNEADTEPIVLEQAWDAAADRERLARDLRRRPHLLPTTRIREASVPRAEFDALRMLASHIEFPYLHLREGHLLLPPAQYGLEGFRRDAVRLRSERVRLEWGGHPPVELKAAVAWARQARALCESCFPDAPVSVVESGPSGTCSLCRRIVTSESRLCPLCGVRYHEECWDYLGRCAVYGCRGD
jgi:hypothetical protein